MGFDVVDIDHLPGEGPGGMVRKVRRAAGAQAFGINYFVFPPDTQGREHDHAHEQLEEVYFVVKGAGRCGSTATRSSCGRAASSASIRLRRACLSLARRGSST
jgi:hypothetical protein